MSRLVDLTSPIDHGQDVYPGDPPVRVETIARVERGGYALRRASFSLHTGTHADSPAHVFAGAASIDQVPLETFCGPATVVDLAPGGRLRARARIGIPQLEIHQHSFRKGSRIILRTGWDRRLGTRAYFRCPPGLTVEACRWLAERGIRLLALDLPTPGPDGLECHRALLGGGSEVVLIEGLRNIEKLPRRVTLMAFPLRFKGADGAPVRAVARIP
jgi:kynurenine formamidase